MPMIEEMEVTGNWLFRRRRYLPLITVILFLAGLREFTYPLGSARWDHVWGLTCLGISLFGLLIRVVTVGFAASGTSGRNRDQQVADTLNTTGIYSIVRNPLYLGNLFIGLGASLFLHVWWVSIVYVLAFLLYYERIIFAEEMFLRRKFGDPYLDWAAHTPLLFPRFRRWQPPALALNWRKILRQEHQTLFGIVLVFYILEIASQWRAGLSLFRDATWNAIAIATLVMFITARILHKRTTVLRDREPGPANAGECEG